MRTDEELMLAYGQGEIEAYETLVRRYWKPVFGFVRRMVKDAATAEEVVGETFFKLHRAASIYAPRSKFSTYLFSIAYNESVSALRSAGRRLPQVNLPPSDEKNAMVGKEIVDQGRSPLATLEQRRLLQQVDRALDELPEAQKAAFLLFYREELSIREISEALALKPGSVRAYLTFARAALRETLGGLDELLEALP